MFSISRNEIDWGGRKLVLETGRIARQADGAVLCTYGDTVVLCSVVGQRTPKPGINFFPLTVEYREKSYAAGKIPGGFFKREGRPSEKEILSARVIDRPIRPLFPEDFKGDTQCIVYVISHDQKNDTDVMALIGTAAAIAVSDVPMAKTIAGVRVGRIDGQLVVNPTIDTLEESDLNITMAGSADSITMVEGSAREVSEEAIIEALLFGHDHIKMIVAKIDELKRLAGKPVFEYTKSQIDPAIVEKVKELAGTKYDQFNRISDKDTRRTEKKNFRKQVLESLAEAFPEKESNIKEVLESIDSDSMRSMILKQNVRIDGRGPDDIREITCDVGLLPRAHGSALFTRGQTQALVAVTLGTKIDEQRLDELEGESTKSYMLHYNFPPFSTGETKPIRGTSRREIGHGNLAERALQPVIPAEGSFPYTVRVVSDIMESNGSSSMATVCGASLALMDAGVPIRRAVAGIAAWSAGRACPRRIERLAQCRRTGIGDHGHIDGLVQPQQLAPRLPAAAARSRACSTMVDSGLPARRHRLPCWVNASVASSTFSSNFAAGPDSSSMTVLKRSLRSPSRPTPASRNSSSTWSTTASCSPSSVARFSLLHGAEGMEQFFVLRDVGGVVRQQRQAGVVAFAQRLAVQHAIEMADRRPGAGQPVLQFLQRLDQGLEPAARAAVRFRGCGRGFPPAVRGCRLRHVPGGSRQRAAAARRAAGGWWLPWAPILGDAACGNIRRDE